MDILLSPYAKAQTNFKLQNTTQNKKPWHEPNEEPKKPNDDLNGQ